MSKRAVSVVVFIVVALIVVIIIAYSVPSASTSPSSNSNTRTVGSPVTSGNTNDTSAATSSKTYTLVEVTKHNQSTDCWTTINGDVYDVTSWISKHPGGEQAIIGLCGIDGSTAFNGQHGGQKRPESELVGFKIGDLAR